MPAVRRGRAGLGNDGGDRLRVPGREPMQESRYTNPLAQHPHAAFVLADQEGREVAPGSIEERLYATG